MLPQSSPLLESAISKPYSHLTSAILNPKDLATRASSKSHDIRDQELRTHLAELAKEQLLQRGLEMITTASTTSSLSISRSGRAFPKRLRETLDIFTHAPTSSASLQIVSPNSTISGTRSRAASGSPRFFARPCWQSQRRHTMRRRVCLC